MKEKRSHAQQTLDKRFEVQPVKHVSTVAKMNFFLFVQPVFCQIASTGNNDHSVFLKAKKKKKKTGRFFFTIYYVLVIISVKVILKK